MPRNIKARTSNYTLFVLSALKKNLTSRFNSRCYRTHLQGQYNVIKNVLYSVYDQEQ